MAPRSPARRLCPADRRIPGKGQEGRRFAGAGSAEDEQALAGFDEETEQRLAGFEGARVGVFVADRRAPGVIDGIGARLHPQLDPHPLVKRLVQYTRNPVSPYECKQIGAITPLALVGEVARSRIDRDVWLDDVAAGNVANAYVAGLSVVEADQGAAKLHLPAPQSLTQGRQVRIAQRYSRRLPILPPYLKLGQRPRRRSDLLRKLSLHLGRERGAMEEVSPGSVGAGVAIFQSKPVGVSED
jgi:hypothetical protein